MTDQLKTESLRTLVVGAGETGHMTVKRMLDGDYDMPGLPVVIVDDDPAKANACVHGVPIKGTRTDIPRLAHDFDIQQIVFAIPSASRDTRLDIFDLCLKTDARVVTLPHILGTPIDQIGRAPFKPVEAIDLLAREEIVLDSALVSTYVQDRRVLVTGGGGSIGSELCRQLIAAHPARIVIFDIYENTAYELLRELEEDFADRGIEFVVEIGSIRDEARLDALFREHAPQVVFHAAAHKHVPLMERNPREAVLNNVQGTLNVVKRAHEHAVERFVFISTDKAVNPTSVMGATKRMGEMIVQYYAANSHTVFAAVRFGNVLGSHGSVIPLFKRQIEQGGPITVTHKDITRYFMTIPEASRLVLQAGALARGGEIFVLNMGEPVRIYDLAEKMVRLSGFTPGVDMRIEITGLRPGEKLFEELIMDEERTIPTENKDILVSTADAVEMEVVRAKIDSLVGAAEHASPAHIKCVLADVVETYRPTTFDKATG